MNIYADSNMLTEREEDNNSIDYFNYTDEQHYPFYTGMKRRMCYLPSHRNGAKPNIVILMLEGVGRAYANEGALPGQLHPLWTRCPGIPCIGEFPQHGRQDLCRTALHASFPTRQNRLCRMGDRMPRT